MHHPSKRRFHQHDLTADLVRHCRQSSVVLKGKGRGCERVFLHDKLHQRIQHADGFIVGDMFLRLRRHNIRQLQIGCVLHGSVHLIVEPKALNDAARPWISLKAQRAAANKSGCCSASLAANTRAPCGDK